MADIEISGLDDSTLKILASRARSEGRSLEDHLRDLVERFAAESSREPSGSAAPSN